MRSGRGMDDEVTRWGSIWRSQKSSRSRGGGRGKGAAATKGRRKDRFENDYDNYEPPQSDSDAAAVLSYSK